MRKFLAACMAIVMIFTIAGCSSEGHEGEAKTPSGSSIQKGKAITEEHRQAICKPKSEEGRRNMALARQTTLYRPSEETKKKITETLEIIFE